MLVIVWATAGDLPGRALFPLPLAAVHVCLSPAAPAVTYITWLSEDVSIVGLNFEIFDTKQSSHHLLLSSSVLTIRGFSFRLTRRLYCGAVLLTIKPE